MKIRSILGKWGEYFKKKNENNPDKKTKPNIELWEEDYLVKKIKSRYNSIPEDTIRNAVKSCYIIFRSPQSAEKLVQCVISKLDIADL